MGSTQSVPVVEDDEDEEEEEEDDNGEPSRREMEKHLVKKVLEQEPEILPCHASASPLSPQLSSPLIRARSMAISICQVISNCAFNYA
jgi:hypothetical protein